MGYSWRGFYINLDRSADRRAAIEAGIARAGLAGIYERFPAIGGEGRPASCRLKPGQYGCFRSHHDLLASVVPDGRCIHVLEDDAVVSPAFASSLDAMIGGGSLAAFDLVFTETMLPVDVPLISMLKLLFDRSAGPGRPLSLSVIDMKTIAFAGTTSYLVTPNAVAKVAERLAAGLAAGPARPVDLYIRDEVRAGRLHAGLIFPFLTSIDMEAETTVAPESASGAVSLLLRNSFFVGRDLAASRRQMEAILASAGPAQGDAHLDLLGDILRFMASDRFRPF